MSKMRELQEELEFFKSQLTIAGTAQRVDFLNKCIINSEARIAKLQNEQYDQDKQ